LKYPFVKKNSPLDVRLQNDQFLDCYKKKKKTTKGVLRKTEAKS
jgi:hypothetical protein